MASQPFASRSYAGGKLPDRSSLNANANMGQFSTSAGAAPFARQRQGGMRLGGGSIPAAPPEFVSEPVSVAGTGGGGGSKHVQMQQGLRGSSIVPGGGGPQDTTNPVNRLTDEQRSEIHDAVSGFFFFFFLEQ